jgi:hypothetical protein
MSYDLMVFDTETAPKNRVAFLEWFDREMEGENDGEIRSDSPAMQAWHQDMLAAFPDTNDLEEDDMEDGKWGEYSIATGSIYVSFAGSQATAAYQTMKSLAAKHGVGFFNVSDEEGEIIFPSDGASAPLQL